MSELNENNIEGADDIIFWHLQKDIPSDYFHNLLEYYLYNYNIYYKYCHDCKYIIPLLSNNYLITDINKNDYNFNIVKILQTRFLSGQKDIFIPFSEKINNIDIKSLKEDIFKMDNFLQINFYFVSIDKNIEAKKRMYKNFTPFSKINYGNFYFLEANNLLEGYKVFLNNSYLKNKEIFSIEY